MAAAEISEAIAIKRTAGDSDSTAVHPDNTFTLTASHDAAAKEAPTGTTATTPGSKVAKTITYALNASKPDDLKPHVGQPCHVSFLGGRTSLRCDGVVTIDRG
jgi:hypothetical protein